MTHRIFISIIIFSGLVSGFVSCNSEPVPPVELPGELSTRTITVDARERRFLQYMPAGWNNLEQLPVVFALHGGTGTPEKMIENVNYRQLADQEKFIVIYPAGIANNWNDGRPTDANLLGIDDVKFFSVLIDQLIAEETIDPKAVYFTGVSNGGFMASRLGCELSDKITAIAPVAATIEANSIYPACNPTNSVPALYIHGTLDEFVPFYGGELPYGDGGFCVSHAEAIAKWNSINNITDPPIITDLPDIADDGTTITETLYSNASNGMEVISYVVHNGGHTWPQGEGPYFPNLVGLRSQDMDAKLVIWEFFKRHKKP